MITTSAAPITALWVCNWRVTPSRKPNNCLDTIYASGTIEIYAKSIGQAKLTCLSQLAGVFGIGDNKLSLQVTKVNLK